MGLVAVFYYEYWGEQTLPIKMNMALEEFALARSERMGVATVRFWDVRKDAVVLGYGESPSAIKRADRSFDLARRITGGSHVQFDSNCLAYSFTVPMDGSFKHFDDMRKYYAEKIGAALTELGIDVSRVDNRASTINVDGRVVASHAMYWGVKSSLMHGLMLINKYDVNTILRRVRLNERKIGRHVYSEEAALRGIPALGARLANRMRMISPTARTEYAKRLIEEEILKQITGGNHANKQVGSAVFEEAERIVSETHIGKPWVLDRTPPLSSDRVDTIPGEELDGKLRDGLGYCLYSQVTNRDFARMSEPIE
ncbi:MAG: hypothetical protein M1474_00350 [Candidatus Marsarchaeota archaeon]|nr:hypothetical protein [Candidatus Marsarchaeota archaeon]